MDFCVLQEDDWVEIEGVNEAVRASAFSIDDLWKAVGRGDHEEALKILLDAECGAADMREVQVAAFPDDIFGKRYRIWVR